MKLIFSKITPIFIALWLIINPMEDNTAQFKAVPRVIKTISSTIPVVISNNKEIKTDSAIIEYYKAISIRDRAIGKTLNKYKYLQERIKKLENENIALKSAIINNM